MFLFDIFSLKQKININKKINLARRQHMNKILLVTLVIGVLAVFAISAFSFVKANLEKVDVETEKISDCSGCQGKCTPANNCGVSTCQAKVGRTCGCN